MKKAVIVLGLIFGLSGCGVMQRHQEQARIDEAKAQLKENNDKCGVALNTDPRLDPLRPYLNFDGQPSIEQLSSTKKPNAKEKQAILAYDEIATWCFSSRESILLQAGAPYYLLQSTREYAAAAKQAKADLWAGTYTYGQYLKVAKQNWQNSENTRVAGELAEQQRYQQAQMQQAQINATNAQAAAAVMSAQAQQQSANAQTMMMFNQAQQQQRQKFNAPGTATNPVQTNCNRIGNSVNCQTYSY